jgi:hypothetical protein
MNQISCGVILNAQLARADFKNVVVPLIREQFDVALRNDLPRVGGEEVSGWKNVKLVQSMPNLN